MSDEGQRTVWSEYERLKHTIMDVHSTFLDSLEMIHMYRTYKPNRAKAKLHGYRAQRQLHKLFHILLPSGVIGENVEETDLYALKRCVKREEPDFMELDRCAEILTKYFQTSGFYNLMMKDPDYFAEDIIDPNDKMRSNFIGMVKGRVSVKQNKNFLCVITGPTGSGKSYASLSFAQVLDKKFTVEERVCFSAKELITLINSGTLSRGSVIIFEEAGVGISNREWQKNHVKLVGFLNQTQRHRNYIIFFNTPDFGFIDAQNRKLFHMHLVTNGIDFERKLCRLDPYRIDTDQVTGKIERLPWFVHTNKQVIYAGLPSPELVKQYEKTKTAFTDALNKDIEEQLNGKPKLTQRQDSILDMIKRQLPRRDIMEQLGINSNVLGQAMAALRKKGYGFSAFKTGHVVDYYEVSEP